MLLMLDNYDSFTYNIVRYFEELGADIAVKPNDALCVKGLAKLKPRALIVSPGPCTPNEAGVSLDAIKYFAGRIPVLGICLGHQAIAQAFGGKVVRASHVMHGQTSIIQHTNEGLFRGLPEQFKVARYHSLIVDELTLPECLHVDAWLDEGANAYAIMALSHKSLPIHGVQFHPESILSEQGHALFNQFIQNYGLI